MRAHYTARHAFVCDLLGRWLGGLLDIRPIEPGMYLTATLPPGWDDRAVAAGLAAAGVVALPLSALTLAAERPPGLVLGYAGHDEAAMARAAERMANVLEQKTGMVLMTEAELY
jgi:GntR family transcriptional regulator/MocR family aminotransferase